MLDLDETLIHYMEMPHSALSDDPNDHNTAAGGHFLIRPGAHMFLAEMRQHYEIVIFTAAMQDYADWVLDQLDPEGLISYRLYRQHALRENHVYLKDLNLLGRDLARTVIVDNVAANFQNQP